MGPASEGALVLNPFSGPLRRPAEIKSLDPLLSRPDTRGTIHI
jgi:hypothetical protein